MFSTANPLLTNLWPGLLLWSGLYISDYAMTIWGARLYRAGACEKIVMEGSYELTPYYQADIDSLRIISPRFIRALVLTTLILSVLWWISGNVQLPFYEFALGVVICPQFAIHKRHLSNVFLFRDINSDAGVRGRIEYPRRLTLRMSSLELFSFAGIFLMLSAFMPNWFLLAGALACFSIGIKHWKFAAQCAQTVQSRPAMPARTGESPAQP